MGFKRDASGNLFWSHDDSANAAGTATAAAAAPPSEDDGQQYIDALAKMGLDADALAGASSQALGGLFDLLTAVQEGAIPAPALVETVRVLSAAVDDASEEASDNQSDSKSVNFAELHSAAQSTHRSFRRVGGPLSPVRHALYDLAGYYEAFSEQRQACGISKLAFLETAMRAGPGAKIGEGIATPASSPPAQNNFSESFSTNSEQRRVEQAWNRHENVFMQAGVSRPAYVDHWRRSGQTATQFIGTL